MYRKAVKDLCEAIDRSGRPHNPKAVARLVEYWRVRTPLSASQICEIFKDKMRMGFDISLSSRDDGRSV